MTHHDLFFSSGTQIEWACRALMSGRTISPDDEIAEAKGWRLAAIVWRLKHRYHWPIFTTFTGPENRASYKLMPETDRTKLQFPPSARGLAEEVQK